MSSTITTIIKDSIRAMEKSLKNYEEMLNKASSPLVRDMIANMISDTRNHIELMRSHITTN